MRALAPLLLALLAACAPARPRLVDLTHPLDPAMPRWPGSLAFERGAGSGADAEGGYLAGGALRLSEHAGTHVDAPAHTRPGAATVDLLPLSSLAGPGALVDASAACAADPGHRVGVAELEAWERRHGRLPPGAVVLVRTGWSARWSDPAAYLGTAEAGPEGRRSLRFPGLDPAAARWLAARGAAAVGVDLASVDAGEAGDLPAHRALAEAGLPVIENLAGLERLPPRGFDVYALPLPLRGGSGAPARVIAVLR
jgi:kynurenine formamidase